AQRVKARNVRGRDTPCGVVAAVDDNQYKLPALETMDERLEFDVEAFTMPGALAIPTTPADIPSIPSLPTNTLSSSVPSVIATADVPSCSSTNLPSVPTTAGTNEMETIFSPKPDAIQYHSFMSAGDILREVKATTPASCQNARKIPRTIKEALDSPSIDDLADYRNIEMPDAPSIEMVPYRHVHNLLRIQHENADHLQKTIEEQATMIAQRDKMIHELQRQCQALTTPQAQEPRQGEIDDLRWRLSVEERRLKTVKEERDHARTRCSELRRNFLEIHERYWQLRKDVHILQYSGSIHKMDRLKRQVTTRDSEIAKLQHEVVRMRQLLNFYCVDEYAYSSEDEDIDTDTSEDEAPISNNVEAGGYPPARINRDEGADSMAAEHDSLRDRGSFDADRMFRSVLNDD
ncbi:hypothetical protein MPER_12670, partial [Moniliophthora perniciosa FA553]